MPDVRLFIQIVCPRDISTPSLFSPCQRLSLPLRSCHSSTVVGSRKSLSPRIKSSNDDFYTNRGSDKFSITYPKSAEIHFGEKYLSLFQKTHFVGKIHNLQIFPMAHQHLSTHVSFLCRFIACAQVVNA